MKLVVDKVTYGLVPYGPGTGTRSLGIYFKETDGDFDYKAELDDKGNPLTEDPIAINAAGILGDILNKIKADKLEQPWASFLLGREYVYFIGEDTAAPAYRKIIGTMLEVVAKMALDIQKKQFEGIDDEKKLAAVKKQLHAPMPVFVGEPKYYTGLDTFYENFNLVLLQLPLTSDAKFNQMAMVEVANHAFSVFVLKMNKDNFEEQKKVLKESYEDIGALSLPPTRVFIVDETGDDSIAEFALEKGYRINHTMNYSDKYQLSL